MLNEALPVPRSVSGKFPELALGNVTMTAVPNPQQTHVREEPEPSPVRQETKLTAKPPRFQWGKCTGKAITIIYLTGAKLQPS